MSTTLWTVYDYFNSVFQVYVMVIDIFAHAVCTYLQGIL